MTAKRRAFTLQLTERCNLACRYCYVRRRKLRDPLDCTVRFCEEFIDFALRESDDRVKVTFFGGEPLLRQDLIRHTVAFGKKVSARLDAKSIGFHLVTNGTLIDDDTGDYLAGEGIGLEVSLDGPAAIHDRNRPFSNGASSFHIVYGNLLRFVERHPGHPVSIFSVMTSPESIPWLHALRRGLGSAGFTLNPVRPAPGEELPDAPAREAAAGNLRKRIAPHREAFLRGDTGFDEGINREMARMLGGGTSPPCGAGIDATIITRTGDIYPCPFFVGHEGQIIGNIARGFDPDKVRPFVERTVAETKRCPECLAKPVCGPSTCAFEALEMNGRVDIPSDMACARTREYARSLETSLVTLASKKPSQLIEKTLGPRHGTAPAMTPAHDASPPRSYVIRLTGQCNLACDYCFERVHGVDTSPLALPTARLIARHILESPVASPTVCLFGGEPLLNWEVGEFLVEAIADGSQRLGKQPFFHIVTNGTLITPEIARGISRHDITVQVSVDGPQPRHDLHRKYPGGNGSYQAMLRGVETLRSIHPEAKIDAQVVLTPGNLDVTALAEDLRSMGFRRLSFLVAAWGREMGIEWSGRDLENLLRAREDFFPVFLDSLLGGDFGIDMGFAAMVATGPDGPTGLCECGTGEVYIDTAARIHLCPQLHAAGSRPIGDCGQALDWERLELPPPGKTNEVCLSCRAYPHCRGGCMVRNQRCPWVASAPPSREKKSWCGLTREEVARAILAHQILARRTPDNLRKLKKFFAR